jgi:hypothetical protein
MVYNLEQRSSEQRQDRSRSQQKSAVTSLQFNSGGVLPKAKAAALSPVHHDPVQHRYMQQKKKLTQKRSKSAMSRPVTRPTKADRQAHREDQKRRRRLQTLLRRQQKEQLVDSYKVMKLSQSLDSGWHTVERQHDLRFVKSRLPLPDHILYRSKQQHPACIGYDLFGNPSPNVASDFMHPAYIGHAVLPTRKEGDELLVESDSTNDPSAKCHPSFYQTSTARVPRDFDSSKLHPMFFGMRIEHIPEYKLDFEFEEDHQLGTADYGLRSTMSAAVMEEKNSSKLWYNASTREQQAVEKIRTDALWANPKHCRICGGTEEPGCPACYNTIEDVAVVRKRLVSYNKQMVAESSNARQKELRKKLVWLYVDSQISPVSSTMDLSTMEAEELKSQTQSTSQIKTLSSTWTRPGSPVPIPEQQPVPHAKAKPQEKRKKKVPRLTREAAKPYTMQTTAGVHSAPMWRQGLTEQLIIDTERGRKSTGNNLSRIKDRNGKMLHQPMSGPYLWNLLTTYHEPEEVLTRSRQEMLDTYMRTEGAVQRFRKSRLTFITFMIKSVPDGSVVKVTLEKSCPIFYLYLLFLSNSKMVATDCFLFLPTSNGLFFLNPTWYVEFVCCFPQPHLSSFLTCTNTWYAILGATKLMYG